MNVKYDALPKIKKWAHFQGKLINKKYPPDLLQFYSIQFTRFFRKVTGANGSGKWSTLDYLSDGHLAAKPEKYSPPKQDWVTPPGGLFLIEFSDQICGGPYLDIYGKYKAVIYCPLPLLSGLSKKLHQKNGLGLLGEERDTRFANNWSTPLYKHYANKSMGNARMSPDSPAPRSVSPSSLRICII